KYPLKPWVSISGEVRLKGCFEVRPCVAKQQIGTKKNPAPSCKAILDNDRSARSGVYYIKTKPTVTKAYCYMENVPGCGGGGWTTIMKTNGYMQTFRYDSIFWKNKDSHNDIGGQSGTDIQETKLPTYWTLPFTKLCLGMKTKAAQQQPKWVHLNYQANSLYSVIADGNYRGFSIGRDKWKSLLPGSYLQPHCNREGFNSLKRVRIGIEANNENNCGSPDSHLGFGLKCHETTGNCGQKKIKAHGYILAQ
ncbi:hypothetical protein QZH41_015319, partial [Actinostola sp. cb2023]